MKGKDPWSKNSKGAAGTGWASGSQGSSALLSHWEAEVISVIPTLCVINKHQII